MNIQEENSARYFLVQSEREQTLVKGFSCEVKHALRLKLKNYRIESTVLTEISTDTVY